MQSCELWTSEGGERSTVRYSPRIGDVIHADMLPDITRHRALTVMPRRVGGTHEHRHAFLWLRRAGTAKIPPSTLRTPSRRRLEQRRADDLPNGGSPVSVLQSWTFRRRSRFTSERRRFWAILRSTAAFVGRVRRRGRGGGAIAALRTSTSRPSAASRFRACERCSDATTVRTPSTSRPARRSSARARRDGPKAEELATSKSNSTRESVVFTPCPPGPDERENRQTNSDSGITLERTRTGPGTRQGCSASAMR